jgi:hypothetical protein
LSKLTRAGIEPGPDKNLERFWYMCRKFLLLSTIEKRFWPGRNIGVCHYTCFVQERLAQCELDLEALPLLKAQVKLSVINLQY